MPPFIPKTSRAETTNPDTPYWLALLRCPNTGSARVQRLLNHFHCVEEIFSSPTEISKLPYLSDSAKQYLRNTPWGSIEQDMAWLDKPRRYLISLADKEYPESLREISNPPVALFIEGDPNCLRLPQLAVVGSRNPSRHGHDQAFSFAQDLSESGLLITSGLALGIDGASHLGALAGNGVTIAVFGSGLAQVYPKKHIKLSEQIVERGALVSEYAPNCRPLAHQFPQRNRIISGLSLGTLVVEAAIKSGSLITAKFALEQNREVFAIPGSIHNPLVKGCHYLIKQGAKLVECSADIWEEIESSIISMGKDKTALPPAPTDLEFQPAETSKSLKYEPLIQTESSSNASMLLTQLSHEPSSIDTLVARCHLTVEEISSILVTLEIKGRITSTGGLYIRVPD